MGVVDGIKPLRRQEQVVVDADFLGVILVLEVNVDVDNKPSISRLRHAVWRFFDHCKTGRKKEGNVLFNDALNTFYLQLYGIRHMVKDHSDIERENPLPPHRLLFPISCKGYFIRTIPQTG